MKNLLIFLLIFVAVFTITSKTLKTKIVETSTSFATLVLNKPYTSFIVDNSSSYKERNNIITETSISKPKKHKNYQKYFQPDYIVYHIKAYFKDSLSMDTTYNSSTLVTN